MNPLTNIKNINKLNELEAEYGISEKHSWHQQYKDSAYIYIGGLPYDLTEGDILSVFSQYGEIVNINLVRDKKTGNSKGFCFIAYEDQRSTTLAVDNLNGFKILGRTIRVDHVNEYRAPKENDDDGDDLKRLHKEGCAPKIPSPAQSDDEVELSPKVKKSKKDKIKKSKKAKKEKKKKRKESSSESESSENSEEERPIKIKHEKFDPRYERQEMEQRTRHNERRHDKYQNEDSRVRPEKSDSSMDRYRKRQMENVSSRNRREEGYTENVDRGQCDREQNERRERSEWDRGQSERVVHDRRERDRGVERDKERWEKDRERRDRDSTREKYRENRDHHSERRIRYSRSRSPVRRDEKHDYNREYNDYRDRRR